MMLAWVWGRGRDVMMRRGVVGINRREMIDCGTVGWVERFRWMMITGGDHLG